ncbi:MAG: hypothetical protein GXY32_06040 [Ruminococcaceae bacterium]|nr:hypothetical protein [Oscillospiraceae bacterium]
MKRLFSLMLAAGLALALLAGCTQNAAPAAAALPAPEADESSQFGIDKHINMETIDDWLGRDDVAYIDVRMLFDPADYEAIGGEADLTRTIKGFKVVPYPYLATLTALPVSDAYDGPCLFSLAWNDDGSIASATANYEESAMVVEELFPKDKAIFLMCGGGGYAGMMKALLIYMGWDESLLYNVGANWSYNGDNRLELVVYPDDADGDVIYATWRADYAYIDFDKLHPAR